MKIQMNAKSFKKMECPNEENGEGRAKYVCYVQCVSIPDELLNWMATNPREQKMSTNVARKISDGLLNKNFHELNRGILMSVDSISYDNQKNTVTIELTDPEKHGNIDGGHTLRAIIDAKNNLTLSDDRYVFFEAFTGLESTVELAEARNTSVQVDLKSIEELKNSFDCIKTVLSNLPFASRIQYKMNEYWGEDVETIDIREVLAITIMFSQAIYPYFDKKNNSLIGTQPIQCYSGKEASLKKFINLGKDVRELMIKSMTPIIPDIFDLWEKIEFDFTNKSSDAGKRYGTRKYSKYDNGAWIAKTTFGQKPLQYYIPKGIMYPLVGAFRALADIDKKTNQYYWKKNPIKAWNDVGQKLVSIILDEKIDNPDVLAKNNNLWSNLFKELFIYAALSD